MPTRQQTGITRHYRKGTEMAEDIVRIKVGMSVSYIAHSTNEYVEEILRSKWDAMSEEERERYLDNLAQDHLSNYASAWAKPEEGDGDE
jgi:hypothetical protein